VPHLAARGKKACGCEEGLRCLCLSRLRRMGRMGRLRRFYLCLPLLLVPPLCALPRVRTATFCTPSHFHACIIPRAAAARLPALRRLFLALLSLPPVPYLRAR
jgi:hypothetical protein